MNPLQRALELITTINVTGCGSYEEAFKLAVSYANRGLNKHNNKEQNEKKSND